MSQVKILVSPPPSMYPRPAAPAITPANGTAKGTQVGAPK